MPDTLNNLRDCLPEGLEKLGKRARIFVSVLLVADTQGILPLCHQDELLLLSDDSNSFLDLRLDTVLL